MFALAEGHALFTGRRASGILHSLQLVAVAVVAQAVFGMVKTLTPDPVRRIIALLALMIVLFFHHPIVQLTAIAIAAGLGLVFCRQHSIAPSNHLAITLPRSTSLLAGVLFLLLLLVPPLLLAVHPIHAMAVFQAFYRSGALVFGGGHVVLPLLQSATVAPGWIDPTTFLAGYGGAQALPGPLFTFAAFLGAALLLSPHGSLGASLALIAIFLPGMLLILTFLPFWTRIRVSPRFQAMLAGINAGVVGLLAAALYRPLWTSSVGSMEDLFFVLAAVLALIVAKLPPWMVVAFAAVLGAITTQLP
jgi:chromate transporter